VHSTTVTSVVQMLQKWQWGR